jgi:DNA polymerase III epsilon subunit-like protein
MTYRPYVSLDIETTGVGPEVDVIQIAAVLDEPGVAVENLETFDVILKHNNFKNAEPYALYLNAGLIDTIRQGKDERITWPRIAMEQFVDKLEEWKAKTLKYDEEYNTGMKGKHMIAGKNVAGFDKPKMEYAAKTYANMDLYKRMCKQWVHRTLDPGSMYFPMFGYNPSLSQINEELGRKEVSHNALDDAFDVVYAIRNCYVDHRLKTKLGEYVNG